jgi:hypothetical protein
MRFAFKLIHFDNNQPSGGSAVKRTITEYDPEKYGRYGKLMIR